jgi:hypothetical protein
MSAQPDKDEWMMGGSKDPELQKLYGLSEEDLASLAVHAAYYAMEKSGQNKAMFLYEVTSEITYQLAEHLGVELPDEED